MNKTVMITGSSRGIGKSIAIKFAQEGYNIIINCRSSLDKLEIVKKEIESYGVQCYSYACDVGNQYDVENMFQHIDRESISVDILINNAGISHIGLLDQMSFDEWNHIISTNLSSVFYCSKFVLPGMISKKSGRIINISSVWGSVGASCEVAYSATKGGIDSFTKALAKELAPSNISVNAVALGAIDTEMNEFLEEEDRLSLYEEIPMGRFARCDEVSDYIYQIANSSPYLTGQVLKFDGAWV